MRKLASMLPVCAGLLLSVVCASPALAQTDFSATYQGGTGSCGSTFAIQGKEPFSGSHPVFIYLTGTWEPYDHPSAIKAISKMADLGFVAATVQYDNNSFGDCGTFHSRAQCIFDKSTPRSAIQVLCSRARADCSKGVVVAGFSQGSVLSILARNFEPRVRAVYGMGAGVNYSGDDISSCVAQGNRDLPSNRLRAVNGEGDGNFGGMESTQRTNLEQLTGLSCTGGANGCFRDNDSGWFIVANTATSYGFADHCYMRQGGCNGTTLDQKWAEGTYPWSLGTNLKWLKTFTD